MALHLSLGRILTVLAVVLFGLAGMARAEHFLTHPAASDGRAQIDGQAAAMGPQRPRGGASPANALSKGTPPGTKAARGATAPILPVSVSGNDWAVKAISADRAGSGHIPALPAVSRGLVTATQQVIQPAPQAAKTAPPATRTASRDAKALFQQGVEIKTRRDAKVYITPQNIPKNDRYLKAYSVEKAAKGNRTAVPGLLGIAAQTYRTQGGAGAAANKAYSLADAMRDAVWRKNTSAKLKTLMSSRGRACEDGARPAPSIGIAPNC